MLTRQPKNRVVVTVVDNASTDGSVARVRERFGNRIRLIESVENVGFARGNNLALRRSRARYTLLLNSDARLTQHSDTDHLLDRLITILDENPTIGALGPRLVRPDGQTEESTGSRVTLRNIASDNLLKLLRVPPRIAGLWSKVRWPYAVSYTHLTLPTILLV